jgi:nucleotide-binding universal stress UspA family protein
MARSALPPQVNRVAGEAARSEPRVSMVLGYDQTPESLDALTVALELGGRLSAFLHVVHAIDLQDYPIDPDTRDFEEKAAAMLAEERRVASELLRPYLWGWTYLAGHGDPASLLMRVANEHEALMIVVGSRGEGLHVLVERLISPAVSHRLIERSRRPVLVVNRLHTSREGSG